MRSFFSLSPRRYPRWRWLGRLLWPLSDALGVYLGFALAYWLRYELELGREVPEVYWVPHRAYREVELGLLLLLLTIFALKGLYRLPPGAGWLDHLGIVFSSTVTGISLTIVFLFLVRRAVYSRLIFLYALLTIPFAVGGFRWILLRLQRWLLRQGIGVRRLLVVGDGREARTLLQEVARRPELGYLAVGYLGREAREGLVVEGATGEPVRLPYLGGMDDLKMVVDSCAIDEVVLACPQEPPAVTARLIQACRQVRIPVAVVPNTYELSFRQVDLQELGGIPLVGFKESAFQGGAFLAKRALDLALALITLLLAWPLMLLIALAIRLESPGPVIYRQVRVGRYGRPFIIYKFRTMIEGADALQDTLRPFNEVQGPIFKMRDDPRVTRVGRILRRTSLDELPQIFNILRGEMSWVGPRPAIPEEVAHYEPWHHRRLEALPGLTGLWQVSGRSELSFDEMVRLDIYYCENWTFWMDLVILLRTIPAVLSGRGAY